MNKLPELHRVALVLSLALVSLLLPGSPAGAAGVSASRGSIVIPTYPWEAVKHPYFRGTDKVNIYPYPMQDFLSREKSEREYKTVVLENAYLRVTFLPELGGRIHEVINKTTGEPMFYVNHVIKPGLIGQCGAWISGGVEWNTGPQGHTVSCMLPVAVEILPPAEDGSRSVALGETERIYGTRWTVVVTLRPDRSFIEERIRIYNPTRFVRPYYFWNCTASPNTPGFRFLYPMTLGCDHAGEKFFDWPFDQGKDLTRGTNYQDASSIFAWHCDQDFFGSYNDDLDRGVVSFANHHQLPGKKAWTWGQGGFGRMHQKDLTDADGPYNEVQTGPLLTQAQVGRLEPCEAVEWSEWWYPIHRIGGFTYANKHVAVNAERAGGKLRLRMLGTGTWKQVDVNLIADGSAEPVLQRCRISPKEPSELVFDVGMTAAAPEIRITTTKETLGVFRAPLDLPRVARPETKPKAESAGDLTQGGWEDYLFARYPEAEAKFNKALEKEPRTAEARLGLAMLKLNSDSAGSREQAKAALEVSPELGLAHLTLANGLRGTNDSLALAHAWKAALEPGTAVAGRALAAGILISRGEWVQASDALSASGPWQTDPVCRARLSLCRLMLGDKSEAVRYARENLTDDPLDTFALAILWMADASPEKARLAGILRGNAEPVLELAGQFLALGQRGTAAKIVDEFYLQAVAPAERYPLVQYWGEYLGATAERFSAASARSGVPVYPHQLEDVAVLQAAVLKDPSDTAACLSLGNVLFHLGQTEPAQQFWRRAAEAGANRAAACRALGMAARNLKGNLDEAQRWLEIACAEAPQDAICARDLAGVLFARADKAASEVERRELLVKSSRALQTAFEQGKGRSDYVALLARARNRLGEYDASARMLDQVRVTVWEGSHEVHDLFVQAHLELGQAQLKAGRPGEALKEFDRALEYPENLATGKLENARQAHIQYARGQAFKALGRDAEAKSAWKLAADEPASGNAEVDAARQNAANALKD